ncbi:DUF1345 domain-containing protein [Roseococcus sp. DSY-14]|uniref:DUF1345 domain-containing protein n=1 Tax=Roseococcus sp. DSY-14 TaxID=3369650 RepID=UPI00387ACF40
MSKIWTHGFLLHAALAGGLAFLLAWAVLRTMDAVMVGWCVHVLTHGALLWRHLWCATSEKMRHRAAALAEGRRTVLLAALLAAAVAAGVLVAELVGDRGARPWERVLAVVAIALSWCHVHALFAQEYAHEYWHHEQGLGFTGGDGTPEFSDFLYVAVTIGTSAQISDTETTSTSIRRAVTLHSLVAFAFNAVILAAGVNVLAGLAGE